MNRQAFMENQQEQEQAMIQDSAKNQVEIERLENENIVLEQQRAQNRKMNTRQINEMLKQMTLVNQHVEQQVRVMRAMASKECEDTSAGTTRIKNSKSLAFGSMLKRTLYFNMTQQLC